MEKEENLIMVPKMAVSKYDTGEEDRFLVVFLKNVY